MDVKYKNEIYWLEKDGETIASAETRGSVMVMTRQHPLGDNERPYYMGMQVDELTTLLRAMGWTVEPPTVA